MGTASAPAKLAAEIQQLFADLNLPPETLQPLMGAIGELKQQLASAGLPVGEKAPEFTLPDQTGKPVSLSETLKKGPVVLKFYRGAWCPICNVELSVLQRRLPELRQLGATLLAVSPQTPDKAMTLQEKHNLGFPALSDPEQKVISAYKLQFTMPEAAKQVYLRDFQLDLSKETADGSWKLPIPATYVLDRSGVIRARHVDADYTQRMEPDDILAALRAL